MDTTKARAGIWRTVKKLDAKIPKWRQLIDKDILDLGSIYDCPCGQVFGEYAKGLRELGIPDDADEVEYHALALPIEPDEKERYDKEYAKLTELWKEVL